MLNVEYMQIQKNISQVYMMWERDISKRRRCGELEFCHVVNEM
jgi:hypothetical protein